MSQKFKIIKKGKITNELREKVWKSLIVLGVIPLPGDITKEDIRRIRNARKTK